jgi:putative kinase
MQLPPKLRVTDQEIDVSWLSDKQIRYYERLAEQFRARYRANGAGRQIFTLSGPAGAGKSVITALLKHIFAAEETFQYVNLGLDAFHYPNIVLEERQLRLVKGRYDTYNTEQLLQGVRRFKSGESVQLPTYSRQLHEPLQDTIKITDENTLLLLEGQWLLRDDLAWNNIRTFSNYNLFITGSMEALRENVIQRHMRGGRTLEEASAFYEQSDLLNTREVLKNSVEPDEKLLFYKDI